MFDQHDPGRRQFVGVAALTLASAWLATRDSVIDRIAAAPSWLSNADQLDSLRSATEWLNSRPLTADALQGRVVVVNFWTYTCINWLRSLPYVRAWAERYREHGLVVIGVHTPEFSFEGNITNVRRAVEQMRIGYPVAIDNDRSIWSGFSNHYWPALYFIDTRGRVRDHQFGEGKYEQSEDVIRKLLAEAGRGSLAGDRISVDPQGLEAAADWASLRSPETYVGYARGENLASGGAARNRRKVYAIPDRLSLNHWALAGDWTVKQEATLLNAAGGRIAYRFHARDLHLIMGPAAGGRSVPFRVLIEGQAPAAAHGSDVDHGGNGTVSEQRLYQLVRQSGAIGDRRFEIEFLDSGVEAFAFTFG